MPLNHQIKILELVIKHAAIFEKKMFKNSFQPFKINVKFTMSFKKKIKFSQKRQSNKKMYVIPFIKLIKKNTG